MTDAETTQRALDELTLKLSNFMNEQCKGNVPLMLAVARDFVFQTELALRYDIIRFMEKRAQEKQAEAAEGQTP